MNPSCRIGLTGDVGSGKSKVLGWLAGRGAAVLDADQVVHRLLAEDEATMAAVGRRFSPAVLGAGGAIDRAALAAEVFQNDEARRDLEAILHPAVRAWIGAWMDRQTAPLQVVEAIYLVGSPLAERFEQIWLVVADSEERRKRLASRGWSREAIAARMAAAPPLAPRLAAATQVIDNSGAWAATDTQLERALAHCGKT
ncbi:MAG: dephospho-CoA kinase [Ardenticatenia bacterium]|nr:dephospho-CoA kinase [Ardenticatenia bacterium]